MKHTPGPWRLDNEIIGDGEGNYHRSITARNSCGICEVYEHFFTDERYKDSGLANAHLIAAAPEMYRALDELIKAATPLVRKLSVKKGYHELVALEAARTALRKAEGMEVRGNYPATPYGTDGGQDG